MGERSPGTKAQAKGKRQRGPGGGGQGVPGGQDY
jgi:hypothetical protein